MLDLCHHCDLYVGYGASGVFKPPENRDDSWLKDHCWCCGKSRDEIQMENKERNELGA